jgi:hypothetical protein
MVEEEAPLSRVRHMMLVPSFAQILTYFLQVSLTILRVVMRRSRYSSLLDAFSTCPSFFPLFSSALVSRAAEPVTVTRWPTCWSNLTLLLRRPQLLPSWSVMENSPDSSPLCKHLMDKADGWLAPQNHTVQV